MRSALLAVFLVFGAAAGARADGTDFGPQVRTMFRVAACGGDDPVPDRFGAKLVDEHCSELRAVYKAYKKAWADPAQSFIAELRPQTLTTTVVYPFGGGDLSSALSVFPDATELTTISLEAAGDVRVIDTIPKARFADDVDAVTIYLRRLYQSAYSSTKALQAASHDQLPGTIMMALAGMAVHDMEPVELRYFDIEPDGSLRYLTNDELQQRADEYKETKRGQAPPKEITHYWYEQDSAFANVEIKFRAHGADPKLPLRTYRHIVANLDDKHMTADDRVLRHLRLKGKVAVMTKGASFLLWYDDFTQIREYLLKNIAWMISDASGIPPSYAEPAGYEQITYGDFTGPYFLIDPKNTRFEFVKLWKNQPHHDLPFRFGYPDNAKHNHLMITRPKS
ncbi:MAG TPA: hypothetical protein VGG28_22105 [Kofleriaceae bacterium]|jgi:hypothetical protein